MARRRNVNVVAAVTIFMVTVGIVQALAGNEPADGVEQAPAGVASYAISDVSVKKDTGKAVVGVLYAASWTTGVYPGPAECELDLRGSSGEQLSTFQFQLDSMSPDFRSPDPLLVPIEGSESVVSASGECAAGEAPTDSSNTVTVESPDIVSTDPSDVANRFILTGIVRWEQDVYAGEQACSAAFVLPDGSTTDYHFTLDIPDGAPLQIGLPNALGKEELQSVTCSPFNGVDWP
jgi:hypothetical protein